MLDDITGIRTLEELIAIARSDADVLPGRTLYQYLLSIQERKKSAEEAWAEGTGMDLERAFIEFSIAVHIAVQVAPTLPEYYRADSEFRDDQRSTLNRRAHKMLGIIERIQLKLVNRLVAVAKAHFDLREGRTLYQYLSSIQDHKKAAEEAWADGTGTELERAFIEYSVAVHIAIQIAPTLPEYHVRLKDEQRSVLNLRVQKMLDNIERIILKLLERPSILADITEPLPSQPTFLTDYIGRLTTTWDRRKLFETLLTTQQALETMDLHICDCLIHILDSQDARTSIRDLDASETQSLADAIQDVLNRGTLPSARHGSMARKLLLNITKSQEQLPSSLFIAGIHNVDKHPTFAGGFADVYRATLGKNRVALKRLRVFTSATQNRGKFCREAVIWKNLRHRFILPFLGVDRVTFSPFLCMVSPWMKNGTILKYLSESARGRSEVLQLLLEIAQGLEYLHSMNIVHGDLRGRNILISDDFHACLTDFGLARAIPEGGDTDLFAGVFASSSNHSGSTRWFAPELFAPTEFWCENFARTRATDIYAFACVCVELYTGNPPLHTLPDAAVMLQVIRGVRPDRPKGMPDDVWNLVTVAWTPKPSDRPTVSRIIRSLSSPGRDIQAK